ncbi:hypothetical protein T439DRAFT_356980, partial [Meredithblackwellia eburnea MCA 4105]
MGLLLFPIQVVVLVLLHALLAFNRLATLVTHILTSISTFTSSGITITNTTTNTNTNPTHDIKSNRWKKTPNHLAVILAPSNPLPCLNWLSLRNPTPATSTTQQQLANDLKTLVQWSKQLQLVSLAVYDPQGLLVSNSQHLTSLFPHSTISSNSTSQNQLSGSATLRVPYHSQSPTPYAHSTPRTDVDSGCGLSSAANSCCLDEDEDEEEVEEEEEEEEEDGPRPSPIPIDIESITTTSSSTISSQPNSHLFSPSPSPTPTPSSTRPSTPSSSSCLRPKPTPAQTPLRPNNSKTQTKTKTNKTNPRSKTKLKVLTVHLLSRESGRPHLARVASRLRRDLHLANAAGEGEGKVSHWQEGTVEEVLE